MPSCTYDKVKQNKTSLYYLNKISEASAVIKDVNTFKAIEAVSMWKCENFTTCIKQ